MTNTITAEQLEEALRELLAADDALSAFLIAANPADLGEGEWQKQHNERAVRRFKAIRAARAALPEETADV